MKHPRLRVLLVEDDPDHADLIQGYLDVLHDGPVDWERAGDLTAAIDRMQRDGIDVILLDLRLPDSDLRETLPKMLEHAAQAPIVVLTSVNDMDLALQAVQQGAQDYLVKTELTSELLLRTIQYAAERKRSTVKLEQMNRQLRHEIAERMHAEEALRKFNATLEKRVEQRTEELRRANQALEQRNRELQDFAYVASHDLREPLRKIRSFMGLLETEYGARFEEAARMYIDRAMNASNRMSLLMDDLLAFSRIATQGARFRPVSLDSIVEEVLADLDLLITETQTRIEIGDLGSIEADANQMRRLFNSLIDNAIKFRSPDRPPSIRITSLAEPAETLPGSPAEWRRIVVEDTGIGFDEKYLDRIFAPFQRLHGRSAYGGTGMGLAICRRIVERHGGTIAAESEPGAGSRFTVTLPVRQPLDEGEGKRDGGG